MGKNHDCICWLVLHNHNYKKQTNQQTPQGVVCPFRCFRDELGADWLSNLCDHVCSKFFINPDMWEIGQTSLLPSCLYADELCINFSERDNCKNRCHVGVSPVLYQVLCTIVSNPLYRSGGSVPALISRWGPSSDTVRVRKVSSARDPGEARGPHQSLKRGWRLTFEGGRENSTFKAVQAEVHGRGRH